MAPSSDAEIRRNNTRSTCPKLFRPKVSSCHRTSIQLLLCLLTPKALANCCFNPGYAGVDLFNSERVSTATAFPQLSHTEVAWVHEEPVKQSRNYADDKNEDHNHLFLRRVWLADHRRKYQQKEPANHSDRPERRQLQRVFVLLPKLAPVVIGQPGKTEYQHNSE